MFGFDDAKDNYDQVQQGNQAELSHEVIAGAASFTAMYEFEKSQRNKGETVKHGLAKELLAGLAGAEVDRLAETKGEDAWDRHKAKKQAKENAEQLYDQQYGNQDQYDPSQSAPEHLERHRDNQGDNW